MQKITVAGSSGYDILIDNGIIDNVGQLTKEVSSAKRVMIISDTNVLPLYGEAVKTSLTAAGFEVFSFVFPAGEASKTLDTVNDMIKALCEAHFTRTDLVVALGGGVTGDMAGFASTIYLRGIDFIQIPTTLLSQVDSSVGGKTGCDTSFGKNLIGAFHNPLRVIIDTQTLKTLPVRYKNDGMGEIIKYGCIRSAQLFGKLKGADCVDDIMTDVIYECVDIKRRIVENDFTEQGERVLLNFGHTLAHAIEKYYGFSGIAHGEAVGIGMLVITRASEKVGYTEKGCACEIENLLKKYGLPVKCDISAEKVAEIMLHDKKCRGNSIKLVLIKTIGEAFTVTLPADELCNFFAEGM